MKMRALLLLQLLFVVGLVLCRNKAKNSSLEENFAYIFTYPQSMLSEGKTRACLTLQNAKLPGQLIVTFENITCNDKECQNSFEVTQDYQCFELKVPKKMESEFCSLSIQMTLNGETIKRNGFKDITIFSKSDTKLLLVETDRGRYKPEDLIRIRILVFDFNIMPVLNTTISKVTLNNPQGIQVKVWEHVSSENGLVQLEYQLQNNAPTGNWKIEVEETTDVYFYVENYVLPRFQTTLELPNEFYIDDKNINVKICAKYSYGRPVKGVGVIKIIPVRYVEDNRRSVSKSDKLINGCVTLQVSLKDLLLERNEPVSKAFRSGLEVIGSVTEQGTSETQTTKGHISMNNEPYDAYFDNSNTKLKPGLPYRGNLKIDNRKVNLNGEKMKLCYNLTENWGIKTTTKDCQYIIMSNVERIYFTIPPLKRFTEGEIFVEAILPRKKTDSNRSDTSTIMHLKSFYSESQNSLEIISSEQEKPRHCDDFITFNVVYTINNIKDEIITFNYVALSRYDVVKTGHVNVKPKGRPFDSSKFDNVFTGENDFTQKDVLIGDFEIKMKLDGRIYTDIKLFVYYMINGEVIVDEADVKIHKCLPNKVDIKWKKDILESAGKAYLKISTGKDSLCALTGIDEASTFNYPADAFTIDDIVNPTEFGRIPNYDDEGSDCIMTKKALEQKNSTKYFWTPVSATDAKKVFSEGFLGVISNQKLITKPCVREEIVDSDDSDEEVKKVSRPIYLLHETWSLVENGNTPNTPARLYFPETFLWDMIPVIEGRAVIERTIPDSITNWRTKALCVSKSKGVGLSSTVQLNVFKPFFADVLMPYSIKRNTEIMHLPVAIFNYMNHSIPVRLTLGDNEDMELVDGYDKKTTSMCVQAGDSITHIYRIKGLRIGVLNVSVSAELDPVASENCASEKVDVKRDLVYKMVKVETEGYPSYIARSALLCANDSLGTDHVTWTIDLQEGVVNDTVVGAVTISSDILGPVIENLDNWLSVPTGCGEQTMAGLVPNLYVLRYLKSNNALTKKIEAKALKNMETGYQRILGYLQEDGSFSAFGKSDQEGSMFLTAFVVRTLRLMKEYIHIQDEVIDNAVGWILSHQNSNGCFDVVSHVFHPMGADNDKDNQTPALTSYVAISLKETNINVTDDVYSNAKECISRADKSDNYTMAISSYALGLMDQPDLANVNVKALLEAADVEDDKIYWRKKHIGWWVSGAQDVEVAGYALLALLQSATPENIGYAGSVVRYLQTQMNPQGGYYSTQDSVVALDGMSRFANLVNRKPPNLDIEITTKQSGKHNVQVKKRERENKEKIRLVGYPEVIEVKVKGDGCVLGQAAVKFNVYEKPKVEALRLKVSTKSATKKEQCSLLEVKPCVSYNAKSHSNMALLEVSMPSGYVPDQSSLFALQGNIKEVKKFELIENRVVFYFDKLTSNEICTPFIIQESVVVENKVDPIVKLYDYYTPEISVSQSFKLPICEIDNAIDP